MGGGVMKRAVTSPVMASRAHADQINDSIWPVCRTDIKVSVLLVDDQVIIVEAIRRMLSDQHDIDFHYITDATLALETAQQLAPTVILQDLVMPSIARLSRSDNIWKS